MRLLKITIYCLSLLSFIINADVYINEIMSSNGSSIVDEDGTTSDWIELYNDSAAPVSLTGVYFTNDLKDLTKWQFPNVSIPAKSYLVIFASEKDRKSGSYLHTNFKLSSGGGVAALTASDGIRTFSRMDYPELGANISYGKTGSGSLGMFSTATPNAPNSSISYIKKTKTPEFSHKHGFYNNSFPLIISGEVGSTIRYTTDGSIPTASKGTVYTAPITVSSTTTVRARAFSANSLDSNSTTASYIFLSDIKSQASTPPPGWPAANNVNKDGIQNMDYEVDPNVVNDAVYSKQIDYAFKDIDTISVVTDLTNLFDQSTGIYVNAGQKGSGWERPASIELLSEKGDGFQINGGLRIRGGYSRSDNNEKHSFRLFFSNSYEGGALSYKLFGGEGTDNFSKVDLRTAQNYSWHFGVNQGRRATNTIMRDVFSRDTERDMGDFYTKSRYYHLFLNGLYWGVYQTQERANQNFAEAYWGGRKEDYDVVKSTGSTGGYDIEATYGTLEAANRLWALVNTGMSDNTDYYKAQGMNLDGTINPSYERLLDVDDLIDYMHILLYCGNWDVAIGSGVNNLFAVYNKNKPDGFKWFCHGFEHSFSRGVNGDLTGTNPSSAMRDFNPFYIHNQLMANDNYKQRFTDRLYKHCYNNGALTAQNCVARWNARAEELQYGIIGESARWGDMCDEPAYTKASWESAVAGFRDGYFALRTPIYVNQIYAKDAWRVAGYTSATDFGGPVQFFHYLDELTDDELDVSKNYHFKISNGAGDIKYTLDGSDPRNSAGAVSSNALSAADEVVMTINTTTTVKARTYNNGVWSVLREITFNVYNDLSSIKVTELMVQPLGNNPEFIEIYNDSDKSVNLSGCKFTKGMELTIPPGTILAANSYAVFTNDPFTLKALYNIDAKGQFSGRLDDEGERVKFNDSLGNTIFDFEYDNSFTKRLPARGSGYTLIHPSDSSEVNPNYDNYWCISAVKSGSPGSANGKNYSYDYIINEISNAETNPWFEIHNQGDAGSLSGWYISDNSFKLNELTLGNFLISKNGYFVLSNSSLGGKVSINKYGGELYLVSPDKRYVHGFRYGSLEVPHSWGRVVNSFGSENLVKLSSSTKATANSINHIGPVVISEIMYNHNDMVDFLEITNTAESNINLYDVSNPANCWRISGINFIFPTSSTIAAGEKILLINNKMTAAQFRTEYQIPAAVRIFTFDGALSNSGELLAIEAPITPSSITGLGSFVPYSVIDEVEYSDQLPWPTKADGYNYSLVRKNLKAYGSNPSNWLLSEYKGGSPGFIGKVYNLKVKNGSGDGNYAVGSIVSINAKAADAGWAFSHWGGDVAQITNVNAAATTVTVNNSDLKVQAVYKFSQSANYGDLTINEFMAENSSVHMDMENYNFVDWIELVNNSAQSMNLTNYYLSNDFDNQTMWKFPDGTIINSGEKKIVWMDKLNTGLHSSFSLKRKAGSELIIFDSAGKVIDYISYPRQYANYSYGREPISNRWGYFAQATPGVNNVAVRTEVADFAESPSFSVNPGFYSSSQTVNLSVSDGSAIYYTVNGSEPTESGTLYTAPISVTSSAVIRARSFSSTKLPSKLVQGSYLISENTKLPVVSISIDHDHMFGDTLGFYVTGTNGVNGYYTGSGRCNFKRPWKRPVGIEFFESDGTRAFSEHGESKIYGGWSRDAAVKSLGLFFEDTIEYKMFESGKVDRFDSILLRNGGNRWSGSRIDDAVAQKCVEGFLDLDLQRSRPVLLYVNGKFWATMNMRDKLNEDFIDNHHDFDDDEIELISGGGSGAYESSLGILSTYPQLLDFTSKNDLSLPGNFDFVDSIVDYEELVNYWVTETYAGNGDWANDSGNRYNNIKWWKGDDGGWRWMLYDLDGGLSNSSTNKHTDGIFSTFPFLLDGLRNAAFKTFYIQRATAIANILFKPIRVQKITNDLRASYGLEMQRHINHWNVSGRTPWWKDSVNSLFVQSFNGYGFENSGHLAHGSFDAWYNAGNNIINFANVRTTNYLNQLKNYFSLGNSYNVRVDIEGAEGGTVSVNGVESLENDFSGSYFENIPVKLKAKAKEGYLFAGWLNTSSSFHTDTFFAKGAQWQFYDKFTEPAGDWKSLGYDTSDWGSGNASLGYGDAHTTTLTKLDTQNNKIHTAYFRKKFNVTDPGKYFGLKLNLRRDDGAVIYINGVEAARSNMPPGIITHDPATWSASGVGGAGETTFHEIEIDESLLNIGENVIAVSLHQTNSNSSDFSLDVELLGLYTESGEQYRVYADKLELNVVDDILVKAVFMPIPPIVINEIGFQPAKGSAHQFIEIYNHEDFAVDVSNWSLEGVDFTFPSGVSINPREAVLIVADDSQWNMPNSQIFEWSGGYLEANDEVKLLNSSDIVVSRVAYENAALETDATLALKDSKLVTTDSANWRQSWYRGGTPGKANDFKHPLVLSELYYNPSSVQGADSDYEFIELYNRGDYRLDISDYEFEDGIEFKFPNDSFMDPAEYIVIANKKETYEQNGYQIFEWESGALSNSGEKVRLEDADNKKVFEFEYDTSIPWPLLADGGGYSLTIRLTDAIDYSDSESWSLSGTLYGTPGTSNTAAVISTKIIINEVLTHTDWPNVDFIELYNPTANDIDISGWFLTDDRDNVENYQIPSGAVVPAKSYYTIIEDNDGDPDNNAALPDQFFGKKFSLSSYGEEVYIISADKRYSHGFRFGASANAVSFGRYINSEGGDLFPAMDTVTKNAKNSSPKLSDVIISEIMYNPAENGSEFIEIQNRSLSDVKLYDPQYPQNRWKMKGIDFSFPKHITINAGESLLLIPVATDESAFRSQNEIDSAVRIFKYNGSLANDGERVSMQRPDKQDTLLDGTTYVPYIDVESVKYNDKTPWPYQADGQRYSLVRKFPLTFADDAGAWLSSTVKGGSPGFIQLVTLTVVNGSGSGQYNEGAVVAINAETVQGARFCEWVDQNRVVDDKSSAVTTVSLNYKDLSVRATFDALISWSPSARLTYGELLTAGMMNAKSMISGLFSYNYSVGTQLDAGNYDLICNFVPNDSSKINNAQITVPFSIVPKDLTISADDKQVRVGGSLPALTVRFEGFADGESQSDLSGSYAVSTNADSANVGIYSILLTQGSLSSVNYAFTFKNGELFVYETSRRDSITVTLEKGWNLISVPFKDQTAVDCFGKSSLAGNQFYWNNYYNVMANNVPYQSEKGYWVYSKVSDDFTISGLHAPKKNELVEHLGWNMVGVVKETLVGDISPGQPVWEWNAVKGEYVEATTLEVGKGYWIFKTQ